MFSQTENISDCYNSNRLKTNYQYYYLKKKNDDDDDDDDEYY